MAKVKVKFFGFMQEITEGMRALGKVRTAEGYASTLNSFKRFRGGRDIAFDELDADLMCAYEAFLRPSGVSPNSSSFYMRILRAVYNKAVEKEIIQQRFPFKNVYTGIGKTVKRAVPLKVISKIKNMDLSEEGRLDFARDMFMFSFYTRGMSFVDMAYLKKKDLSNGVLSYRRRKTKQFLYIKWEKQMQDITGKYDTAGSTYLLPIIKNPCIEERKQYVCAEHRVNYALKQIGEKLGLGMPLTMYVARHSWASIARSKNIPVSIISEGMGHDSEATTKIYLASLDNMAIDKANKLILKSI